MEQDGSFHKVDSDLRRRVTGSMDVPSFAKGKRHSTERDVNGEYREVEHIGSSEICSPLGIPL